VFKLDEIQRSDRLIRPGMVVVDLGAAPGGWSNTPRLLAGRGAYRGRLLPMAADRRRGVARRFLGAGDTTDWWECWTKLALTLFCRTWPPTQWARRRWTTPVRCICGLGADFAAGPAVGGDLLLKVSVAVSAW
jgi:hypothetical protein